MDGNARTSLFQNLVPTLIQCFGTIFIGYIFGQTKLLQGSTAKGICIFLYYLSLPSLIFTSLATIEFVNVQWAFIGSVLIAKGIVFIIVVFATLLLTKPLHLAKSGIYAIASTQSNDMALAYPLMLSLYKTSHTDFPSILFIIVPVQLLILNPVGFFLMETYKQIHDPNYSREHKRCKILREILKNPVIMATILGLVWNASCKHYVPPAIGQIVTSLGAVFSTLALFVLGHSMSSEGNIMQRRFSLAPAVLVIVKILLLPIILQKITFYLTSDYSEMEVRSLCSFGFLYGTIPTAPSVFIFAKYYDIAMEIITSATVYGTIFSALLMFSSAVMISLMEENVHNIADYITNTISYTSSINLLCCILLIVTFIVKKQWHNICNVSIIYIAVAQLISSLGGILLFFHVESNTYIFYAGYILQSVGLFSTYMFGTLLAFVIFLLKWRSMCYVLRYQKRIKTLGFFLTMGLTAVITLSLLAEHHDTPNKSFNLGKSQFVVMLTVSILTLLSTTLLMVLGHRFGDELEPSETQGLLQEDNLSIEDVDILITQNKSGNCQDCCKCVPGKRDDCEPSTSDAVYRDVCCSGRNCSEKQRLKCRNDVENYHNEMRDYGVEDVSSREEYKRHMILILYICCSMLVTSSECFSNLVSDTLSGAFLELQFLGSILKHSQGVVCFLLFGVNYRSLLRFFCTRCRSESRL